MGCGSSSTSVQTFKNPEENKNYQSQKAPSRQSSAAPSSKSQKSESKEKTKRKSSASSVLSLSSSDSRRQKKSEEEPRINSASTKKTIQRQNSDVVNDSTPILPVASHDENENVENKTETNVVNFENEAFIGIDEKKKEAQRHHEEIQKQTFITGDPEHEIRDEKVEDKCSQSKVEDHEEIAKRKEERRSQFDHEKIEEEEINRHGPVPLSFPSEMEDTGDKNAEYTIDDIVDHNNKLAALDWFKYGKKIYSWKKMHPIIKERVDQFKDIGPLNYYSPTPGSQFGYPIYIAREHGISRKELVKVLSYCHVGNSIEVPRDQCLARMKQSAENVLEEDTGTDYFKDYKDQLNRWLANYPLNKVYNDPPNLQSDPNGQFFPLPADIQADPSVLRKWIETWTVFDCDVPEEGAWLMYELLKDDWGDTHEVFAKAVQEKHGSEEIESFDMTIDGDVAWVEIELDLLKNDKTTEHQEMVWKKRATRTNLNDPAWMKNRREELAQILKKRYDQMEKDYPVEDFMKFSEILEQHWKEFQKLCEEEFIPPVRNVKNTAKVTPDTSEPTHVDGGEIIERVACADNRLVLSRASSGDERSNHTQSRIESRNSSRTTGHEDNSNKVDIEHEDNAQERLVINHENKENEEDEINAVNADDGANQMPTFEDMDSGLDLVSNDQLETAHANNDENMNRDSVQLTDRPETGGSERSDKNANGDV